MALENESKYPYQDSQVPVDRRVADLMARMSLEDKAGLLFHDMVAPGDLDAPNTRSPCHPQEPSSPSSGSDISTSWALFPTGANLHSGTTSSNASQPSSHWRFR